jgi:DNA-directed RNA polymerase III subunit RPC6
LWIQSFPKRRNANANASDRVLYPPSNAPAYPTAEQIRNTLKKARLTDTELTVEHVEMVLNVLVLDGKIERVSLIFILFGRGEISKDRLILLVY